MRIKSRSLYKQVKDKRTLRVHKGRAIYLLLLFGLALYIFDFLVGGIVYLKADGMVVRTSTEIGLETSGRLVSVSVREGDRVSRGRAVAQVESQEIMQAIARLTAEAAVASSKYADLRMMASTSEQLLPLARERLRIANNARETIETLKASGLLTEKRITELASVAFSSAEDVRRLEVQLRVGTDELPVLAGQIDSANKALASLRQTFSDGVILSPVDGIVVFAQKQGAVVRRGDRIVEVHSGPPY